MKSEYFPFVLLVISALSIYFVLNAVHPWELCLGFIPIVCLVMFYTWLDREK